MLTVRFFFQQSLMLLCSTHYRNCSRVNCKYNCSSLLPGIFHNDTYSMYSRLFSFVTMISDPLGFRST